MYIIEAILAYPNTHSIPRSGNMDISINYLAAILAAVYEQKSRYLQANNN